MTPRVLMVDDEPRVLDALRRTLRSRYAVTTAGSGPEGLDLQREALAAGEPFPVIVSDMMMPGMNGAQFLAEARRVDPDLVAVVLSGHADLDSTIAAVNEAGIFTFLTKPCPPEALTRALDRALEQHRLVLSERELLHRTLHGSVDVLTELLSGINPRALNRTLRIRDLVTSMAPRLGLGADWELSLAAKLSQIGCATIPSDLLDRAYTGAELTGEEETLFRAHPATASALLERIPRLERVAAWVGAQSLGHADVPPPDSSVQQLVLCAATACVAGFEVTGSNTTALSVMRVRGTYPPEVAEALAKAISLLVAAGMYRRIRTEQLRPGMEVQEDVLTSTGMVLVRKGEQVTEALAVRLRNFARSVGIVEPIHVMDYRYQ